MLIMDLHDQEETSVEESGTEDITLEASLEEEQELSSDTVVEEDDVVDITDDDPVEPAEDVDSDGDEEPGDERAWYVVHCYSGYENKVRHNLEQRIETMGMKDMIFDVVVPTEEEIEVREGKRRTVERRVFPGYILVNMIMTEESWYVVRNTPGVTGFVGMGNDPTPRPASTADLSGITLDQGDVAGVVFDGMGLEGTSFAAVMSF